MSFRIHGALLLCFLVAVSVLLVHVPQAAAAAKVSIMVTIGGLPPDMSTRMIVDGKDEGTISGGSSRSFQVDKKTAHTFQVDAEIKGACVSYEGRAICTKFKNPNNVWTLQTVSTQTCRTVPVCYDWYYGYFNYTWWQPYCRYEEQCYTSTELSESGHVFEYFAEHQVSVNDVHGRNVNEWVRDGADLTLSANEVVVIKDETKVKERDIFVAWVVNGASLEGRNLAFKVDEPYFIRAQYRTETKYKVRALSDFGNPMTDSPDGWYLKGEEATVSVDRETPSEGLFGALGGKRIFVAWHGPAGVGSDQPTFTFVVHEPMTLEAEWRTEDSQPITILSALAIVTVAVLVAFLLYRTGYLSRFLKRPEAKQPPLEPSELEKAKAEIEALRGEMEELKKKPPKKRKRPAPEEAASAGT